MKNGYGASAATDGRVSASGADHGLTATCSSAYVGADDAVIEAARTVGFTASEPILVVR